MHCSAARQNETGYPDDNCEPVCVTGVRLLTQPLGENSPPGLILDDSGFLGMVSHQLDNNDLLLYVGMFELLFIDAHPSQNRLGCV